MAGYFIRFRIWMKNKEKTLSSQKYKHTSTFKYNSSLLVYDICKKVKCNYG